MHCFQKPWLRVLIKIRLFGKSLPEVAWGGRGRFAQIGSQTLMPCRRAYFLVNLGCFRLWWYCYVVSRGFAAAICFHFTLPDNNTFSPLGKLSYAWRILGEGILMSVFDQ